VQAAELQLSGGKMNNFEKIKSMTIEEMAEVFNRKQCEECAYHEMNFNNWRECDADCWAHPKNNYYLKWLKEEAENE